MVIWLLYFIFLQSGKFIFKTLWYNKCACEKHYIHDLYIISFAGQENSMAVLKRETKFKILTILYIYTKYICIYI